jgi:hypothetical protein
MDPGETQELNSALNVRQPMQCQSALCYPAQATAERLRRLRPPFFHEKKLEFERF